MLYIQNIVCFLCVMTVDHMRIFQQKRKRRKRDVSSVLYVFFGDVMNNILVFADVL